MASVNQLETKKAKLILTMWASKMQPLVATMSPFPLVTDSHIAVQTRLSSCPMQMMPNVCSHFLQLGNMCHPCGLLYLCMCGHFTFSMIPMSKWLAALSKWWSVMFKALPCHINEENAQRDSRASKEMHLGNDITEQLGSRSEVIYPDVSLMERLAVSCRVCCAHSSPPPCF